MRVARVAMKVLAFLALYLLLGTCHVGESAATHELQRETRSVHAGVYSHVLLPVEHHINNNSVDSSNSSDGGNSDGGDGGGEGSGADAGASTAAWAGTVMVIVTADTTELAGETEAEDGHVSATLHARIRRSAGGTGSQGAGADFPAAVSNSNVTVTSPCLEGPHVLMAEDQGSAGALFFGSASLVLSNGSGGSDSSNSPGLSTDCSRASTVPVVVYLGDVVVLRSPHNARATALEECHVASFREALLQGTLQALDPTEPAVSISPLLATLSGTSTNSRGVATVGIVVANYTTSAVGLDIRIYNGSDSGYMLSLVDRFQNQLLLANMSIPKVRVSCSWLDNHNRHRQTQWM